MINKEFGKKLNKLLNTDEAYRLLDQFMDEIQGDSGWATGGCLLLAGALKRLFKRGSLMAIVDKGIPEHIVLKIDNGFLDSNGFSSEKELLAWWKMYEDLEDPEVEFFDEQKHKADYIDYSFLPASTKTEIKLAELLAPLLKPRITGMFKGLVISKYNIEAASGSGRTAEQKKRIREKTSDAMKRIAERDKCEKCNRKSAMTKMITEPSGKPLGFACRFCGHEKLIGK